MAAIDNLIQVNITQDTTAVATESFGVPLLLGKTQPKWANGEVIRTYTDAAALLDDGFNASSPEYLHAVALMSQTIAPVQFMVGVRQPGSSSGSSTLLTIDYGTSSYYGLQLNGYGFFVSGADIATVAKNLAAAINQQNLEGITASVYGDNQVAVTCTGDAQFDAAQTDGVTVGDTETSIEVSPVLAASLTTIAAQNNDWYALVLCAPSDEDITEAAAYIEGAGKLCFAATKSQDVGTAVDTDVVSKLKKAGYNRTVPMYAPAGYGQGVTAAWVGDVLPTTPGAAAWSYKKLAGITADNLSSQQLNVLYGSPVAGIEGKNCNVYYPYAGTNITYPGVAASGQYIDITIGVDWLKARIQEAVFAALVGAQKVPYTDAGASQLVAAVQGVLQLAVANGLVDGKDADYPIKVTCPPVASVSKQQRANRIAPT
ncbi:MAG: DUF3383 family protein, partial [Deltaproteobacteria bacterium]